ncbi:MarR family winged helix-turn-helix transcriptional regulator [Shinella zoogloeoides]|jgi:DNA-binding MarR family transcriptional regulator|uniref:MarR family transcriptional regulator n=1 Tax=Shinella zoogloeoides TaxID=352475 RepID=A0A6N8TKJ9_SHIZO|nr:MarR family transcriptional regulator [Shinella zoogloeoides]MXO01768.1 MarR family transcriptional regulator [Shinella zoogloeoides]UEX81074.1 MarR family transcriptional regulator [Shinella zoogloeoides]
MISRPDPDALGFVLIDVARMLRSAFERRIATAGLGLTPGEARALVRIATLEGSRQLEIAQRMGIEPMTLSTYLDRLQSLGFIERRADPADRRAKLIFTTPAANALIASIRVEQMELMQHVTSGIGEAELDLMGERLKRLRANLSALEEDSTALTLARETGR